MLSRKVRSLLDRIAGTDSVLVFSTIPRADRPKSIWPVGYTFQPDLLRPVASAANGPDQAAREASTREFPRELIATLDDRQRLHVARSSDGAIVAWGMSTTPSASWIISETGTELILPPRSAVLTSFHVLPAHRGKGLYRYLLAEMLALHAGEGDEHAWIWCVADNEISARGIVRAGFTQVSHHRRRRLFGTSRSWIRDKEVRQSPPATLASGGRMRTL